MVLLTDLSDEVKEEFWRVHTIFFLWERWVEPGRSKTKETRDGKCEKFYWFEEMGLTA